jgi:23S rRNA (uracil-5-)-methyltransferase
MLMRISVKKMDHLGRGIGYNEGKVIFIPKAIPGDVVDIEITNSYKKYDIGKIIEIIEPSNERIDVGCSYYYECGGCHISNLKYFNQVNFKKDKVIDMFKRYLNKEIVPRVISSEKDFEYRNKITYQVRNGKIGLVDINNNFIEIDKCLLVSDRVNKLLSILKKEDLSKAIKIVIRECDNGLILSITGDIKIDNLINECLEIYINGKKKYSKEEGYLCIGNLKYRVSDKSFFQINTSNICHLYDEVIRYGEFTGNERVVDLYCGVGSISLYISKYVKSVLGIEIVKEAIDDANYNKKINKIDNAIFICSDVAKIIDDKIECDTLIVDPPRAGLDKHTKSVINNSNIKKVIYVSCDPMTLVRDLKDLDMYNLEKISIVDMFPQTCHVECVSILHRKNLKNKTF